MNIRFALIAVVLFSISTVAAAADRNVQTNGQLLDKLTACRKLADPNEELLCYHREVSALEAALARKDIVVMDREDVRKTHRSLFGLNLPKLPFFVGDTGAYESK